MTREYPSVPSFSKLEPLTPPAIGAENLSVTLRDGKQLFANLTFEAPAGRTTCILGPSGIGKSILLRLVLGLMASGDDAVRHVQGHLTAYDGQLIAGRAAYMGQSDYLLPWLSVERNVMLGDRLRGTVSPDSTSKAMDLLTQVGLADIAKRYPATLSGGMRQRVALARTLYEDRPVICMDEPFSQLDAITRLHLQDVAADTLNGRTVLMVTHDPLEALRLGHRIIVLGGRPAHVVESHDLPSEPARDLSNSGLLALQAELLQALTVASA